jgi:hypothetical protein
MRVVVLQILKKISLRFYKNLLIYLKSVLTIVLLIKLHFSV